MKAKTITRNPKRLIYIFLYFVLMEPRYFFYVNGIKQLFKVMILLSFAYLFVEYFFIKRTRSKTTLLITLYHGYLITITFIRNGDISTAILDSCIFVGLSMLTEIVLKEEPKFFISELLILFEAEAIVNLFSILLFPNGLYSTGYFTANYFLGYDNQMINMLIPLLFLAYLNAYKKKKYINWFFVCGLVIYTIVKVWSGASLIILGIIMLTINLNLIDITNIFNMRNYLVFNIVSFIGIVIFGIQEKFEYLIINILGKNLTFTGRTYIWQGAIEWIKRAIILGYGVEYQGYRVEKIYSVIHSKYATISGLHAHNRFLETAYRGGLILVIIYLFILIISSKRLTDCKNYKSSKVLSVVIFAYLTGMISEFYRLSYMFFPFMVIAENIECLEYMISEETKNLEGDSC